MHRDPFLLDYEVAPQQFELSRGIAPASVRDQIMRGIETVKRLVALNITPSPGGRLLIIGGGAAGFSAAFQAINQGLKVKLLDKSEDEEPFDIYFKCNTRLIDPTFYDWPLSHWQKNKFISAPTPLHFEAQFANQIAVQWRSVVAEQIRSSADRLNITYNVTFEASQLVRSGDFLKYTPTAETFHAVLFTAGIGEERVWPPDRNFLPDGWNSESYKGPVFWQDDKLDEPRCGETVRPDILIAGTGDGALQDIVRVLTASHPAKIMSVLDRHLTAVAPAEWIAIQYRLLCEQEKAARLYTLSYNKNATQFHKNSDLAILEELHKQFDDQIASFFVAQRDEIHNVLAPYISERQEDLPRIVHLLATGQAFTWCYPANRFLVLLLSKYLAAENFPDTMPVEFQILTNHLLQDTDGINVSIKSNFGNLPSPIARLKYDIVIIRRGIEPPSQSLYVASNPPRERQIFPCNLV